MKGIACGECATVRTLRADGGWTECDCGQMAGRWVDAHLGTAEFRARDKTRAFGIGFNNHFLIPALQGKLLMHQDARVQHDLATAAPGYVFDRSRAGCWAVVFKPGSTNDTSWVDD